MLSSAGSEFLLPKHVYLQERCEVYSFVSNLAGSKRHKSWHRSDIVDFHNTGMVSLKMCLNLRGLIHECLSMSQPGIHPSGMLARECFIFSILK